MKRLIAALSLAALASSAFALEVGPPFDQLELDRALPNIPERAPSPTAYPSEDRAVFAATAGDTRSDAEIAADANPSGRQGALEATGRSIWATGPWANDPHFIAPAP